MAGRWGPTVLPTANPRRRPTIVDALNEGLASYVTASDQLNEERNRAALMGAVERPRGSIGERIMGAGGGRVGGWLNKVTGRTTMPDNVNLPPVEISEPPDAKNIPTYGAPTPAIQPRANDGWSGPHIPAGARMPMTGGFAGGRGAGGVPGVAGALAEGDSKITLRGRFGRQYDIDPRAQRAQQQQSALEAMRAELELKDEYSQRAEGRAHTRAKEIAGIRATSARELAEMKAVNQRQLVGIRERLKDTGLTEYQRRRLEMDARLLERRIAEDDAAFSMREASLYNQGIPSPDNWRYLQEGSPERGMAEDAVRERDRAVQDAKTARTPKPRWQVRADELRRQQKSPDEIKRILRAEGLVQ
jgi:hypothetical protein